MKYYKFWAVLACVGLIVSCFLPWAYYPDIKEVFTGFYSKGNIFGKPAKLFIFFAGISLVFALVDRIWAKRVNVLLAALTIAYLIRTYIVFTGCYSGTCPEKLYGIYILLASSILLMVTSVLPDMKIEEKHKEGTSLK